MGANRLKNIVAGFDGSPDSENALRIACDLARKYDSEIHLVHTLQNQIDELAMRAVGGFYTATTQPLVEDVQIICDITVSSAKATT